MPILVKGIKQCVVMQRHAIPHVPLVVVASSSNRAVLEVDQPSGAIYLLEVNQLTRSTYGISDPS